MATFHGALSFLRTRNERKRPLLTSGTAAFARRFCSEVYSLPRIGRETGSQLSHRGYLLPGWQTAAFAAAIPNAAVSKTSLALNSSFFHEARSGGATPPQTLALAPQARSSTIHHY